MQLAKKFMLISKFALTKSSSFLTAGASECNGRKIVVGFRQLV